MRMLLALALLSLAPVAGAQTITFTAAIEPATGFSICQEESHYVPCTIGGPSVMNGQLLKSSVINLTPFEGVVTTFTAVSRGVTCQMYDVQSAQPAVADLVTCGTAAPGCTVRMRVGPSGGVGQWILFRSPTPTFAPLAALGGTLQIGPPLIFVGAGNTSGPTAFLDILIPNDLGLVGLTQFFQGASRSTSPVTPWQLTNSVCVQIGSPTVPCVTPGC